MNTGVCECLSLGVTGSYCQQCDAVSSGDANNFCFCKWGVCFCIALITIVIYVAEMNVNFIYTYSVDMEREQEGFFIVTPPQVSNLLIGTALLDTLKLLCWWVDIAYFCAYTCAWLYTDSMLTWWNSTVTFQEVPARFLSWSLVGIECITLCGSSMRLSQ